MGSRPRLWHALPFLCLALSGCGTEPAGVRTPAAVAHEGEEAWRIDRTALPVVHPAVDIPTHLSRHPRDEWSTAEDGTRVHARYGGYDIDGAVASIERLPAKQRPARPWTVERLLAWYEGPSRDLAASARRWPDSPRAGALTLLIASRDPRGLRAAGAAIDAGDDEVFIAACLGIDTYWSDDLDANMNLEMILTSATAWWAKHRSAR